MASHLLARFKWGLALTGLIVGTLTLSSLHQHEVSSALFKLVPDYVGGWRSGSRLSSARATARAMATALLPINHEVGYVEPEWQTIRRNHLERAIFCKSEGLCTLEEQKIILSAAGRFKWAYDDTFDRPATFPNGEATMRPKPPVIAKSWIRALDKLGYPLIHILDEPRGMEGAIEVVSKIYAVLGDNIHAVLFDYLSVEVCNQDVNCIKSKENPDGIPVWKAFEWDYFADMNEGEPDWRRPWHLTAIPPDERNMTYIGNSIEEACGEIEFVPPSKRIHAAYIYGKEREYYSADQLAWKTEDFQRVADETGLELIAGIKEVSSADNTTIPSILHNVGTSSRSAFMARLASVKLVVGIGNPPVSPTPLEALCLGTPFLNPTKGNWAQMNRFLTETAPYVYNVPAGDSEHFLEAVKNAIAHPLHARYIPEDLRTKSFLNRLEAFLSQDWKQLYLDTVPANRRTQDGEDS